MNAHTTILPAMLASAPVPPIALLRALPPGPLAREFAHLERARRLADLFAAFDRDDMLAGVELLIAELDARDGDQDLEETGTEDGFVFHAPAGPGCPISDPDGCDARDDAGTLDWRAMTGDDKPGDPDDTEVAWPEGIRQLRSLNYRTRLDRIPAAGSPEDAECDDEDRCAASDDDMRDVTFARMGFGRDSSLGDPDAEPDGDERDGSRSEDDFMVHPDQGPGCPIADPDCAYYGAPLA